jgi:hypothetical protein
MKDMISVQIIMITVWVSVIAAFCHLPIEFVAHTDVTMVQRGPTCVMSAKQGIYPANQDAELDIHTALYSERGPPADIADRIGASLPSKVLKSLHQRVTASIAEADR